MNAHGAIGRFDGTRHIFPVRVYFEDTDLSGIVYHANYLRYMERARSDMLRAVGIDQRGTHDAGGGVYAVSDLQIGYKAPAKLDDDLTVVSSVTKVTAATATIQQRVMRGDQLLTDGRVTAAWLTTAGRPQRQPREWVAVFTALIEEDK
jgi:acyl-CoA thioester hydrolase